MDLDKPEASTSQVTLESRLQASLAREAQLSTALQGVVDYLERANEALPSASQLPHSVLNLLANLHSALLLSSSSSSSPTAVASAGRNDAQVLQTINNLVEENETLYQLLSTGSYASLHEQIQQANQKTQQLENLVESYKSLVQDLEKEAEKFYTMAQQKVAFSSKDNADKRLNAEANGIRKRKSPSPSVNEERRERRRSRSVESKRTRRISADRERQRERDASDRHRDEERRRHQEDRRSSRRREEEISRRDERIDDRPRRDRRDASPSTRKSRTSSKHSPPVSEWDQEDRERATRRAISPVPDKKALPVSSTANSPIRTKVLPPSIDQALPSGPKASRPSTTLAAPTGPRATREDEHQDKRPRSTSGTTAKDGSSRLFSAAVGSSSRGLSIKGAAKP